MKVDIYGKTKGYDVIYADPPWKYGGGTGKEFQGLAVNHYRTMKKKDIQEIPVGNLTENGVLFMWATFPQLKDALEVMEAWGFRYRTVAFVWVKLNKKSRTPFFGLGFWTRSNAEICLIGTKGKDYTRRANNKISQIIMEPSWSHSAKPEEARRRIDLLMGGNLSKIELFARRQSDGWDCWGDEV